MHKPFWLFFEINPEPWAVGPVGYARRGGKMSAYIGRNQQLASFQEAVREELHEQWGDLPPLEGRFKIDVFFWRKREEYKTPQSRRHRKHEADATNLLKAFEDALQPMLINNDRDNISVTSHIMEQSETALPRIILRIEKIDPEEHVRVLLSGLPASMRKKIAVQITNSKKPFTPSNNEWNG